MGTRSRDSAGSGSTIAGSGACQPLMAGGTRSAGGGGRGEPEVEGTVSAEEETRGAESLRTRMSGRGQARVSAHFIPWEHDANRQIENGGPGMIGPGRPSPKQPYSSQLIIFLFLFLFKPL